MEVFLQKNTAGFTEVLWEFGIDFGSKTEVFLQKNSAGFTEVLWEL
jgi:hypothetical protein